MTSTLSRRIAPVAVLVSGLGSAALALAPAAHADTNTVIFNYTGTEQTWVVPDRVTSIHVEAVGGRGGSYGSSSGGSGAVATADVDVSPHQTLYVEVGGNGQDWASFTTTTAGGFNGGGDAPSSSSGVSDSGGGGGGGASDVRTATASAGLTPADPRLLVAGGGGGAGSGAAGGPSAENGTAGGPPESPFGCDAESTGQPGDGADQTSPGTGGAGQPTSPPDADGRPGTVGSGGDGGADDTVAAGGAGGGGGWLGGGGGGAASICTGAGGGGSSHVDSSVGHNASYDTDTTGTPQITISYLVPLAPLATTGPASGIGQTSATLNGVVNPEGYATSYHFDYGIDPKSYSGSTSGADVIPTDEAQHDVSAPISGLSPGTIYYFRLVAHNDNGDTYGDAQQFTTAAAPTGRTPLATTSPASSVGWTKAQLNGVVNARGADTTYYFRWGTTTAYGNTTPAQDIGSAWANKSVKALLSGLARHTTYHFRLVATNANGTVQGVDRTFRTG